jgi:hypothetical protein
MLICLFVVVLDHFSEKAEEFSNILITFSMQGQACPHATFLDREQEMQTNCGVTVGDTNALGNPSCPSAVCAGVLISLLEDCADSIERGTTAEQQSFYADLGQSPLFEDCVELDQSTADFAELQVRPWPFQQR